MKKILLPLLSFTLLSPLQMMVEAQEVNHSAMLKPLQEVKNVRSSLHLMSGVGHSASSAPDVIPEGADEYLLVGKSMFDPSLPSEEQNVYAAGGRLCSYPVYVKFNTESNEVEFTNLVNMPASMNPLAVKGVYDSSDGSISIATNPYFFDLSETALLSYNEPEYIVLQGGNPTGTGYWNDLGSLEMIADEQRNVIRFDSGFAGMGYTYDEYWEEFNYVGVYDVMYNTTLFKRVEGVNILSDKENISEQCFVGRSKEITFDLINTGNEGSDFVVTVKGEGFEVLQHSGNLEPDSVKTIAVKFSPDEAGTYQATVTVQSEGEPVNIYLTGTGNELPDYSVIVTGNASMMQFDVVDDYPWIVTDEITGTPVAVSTNKGVGPSESSFGVDIVIPDGKKGRLSWKGYYDPRYGVRDRFRIMDNGNESFVTPLSHAPGELDGVLNLVEGSHHLDFVYEKDYEVEVMDVEYGNDYTYLSELALDVNDYKENDMSFYGDSVDFGRFFLVTDHVAYSKTGPYIINEGYAPLVINEIRNGDIFEATVSTETVEPEGKAEIEVSFDARTSGIHEEDIVISTSAGDVTIHCSVEVEPSPDYSSIVKQGEFLFVPDNLAPFVVDGNTAYNSTSGIADGEETLSVLTAFFDVPDGKIGYLTWKGQVNTGGEDYGVIMIDNNSYNLHLYRGHDDAGPFTADPYEVYLEPGTHLISFGYVQSGDNMIVGLDRFTVSDLSIEYLDEMPGLVVWQEIPVDMKDVFVGHRNVSTILIANMNASSLAFMESADTKNFTSYFDAEMCSEIPQYGLGEYEITFVPVTNGPVQEELVLTTSNGKISIPVKGYGKDTSHAVFIEDFEEGIDDWTVVDANEDKYFWEDDTYGTYARTGLGSMVINTNFSDYTDDYVISPEFTVPAGGGVLNYWRRYTKSDNNAYGVLIGEGDDPHSYDRIYTDEGHSQYEFEKVSVDLDQYAGKTVHIAFHNYTDDGRRSVLVIDDLEVVDHEFNNSVTTASVGEIVDAEFFTIDGVKVDKPVKGINIMRGVTADGKVVTRKIIVN